MRDRHAQEKEDFSKKAVEERFAARTSVLVMQKLELELKQRDAEMKDRHKSEWAATPWGAPPDPNAEAPPPTKCETAVAFLREQHSLCKRHRGDDDYLTVALARNLAVALLRSEAATSEMQCEAEALLEDVVRASSDWSHGAVNLGSTVGPDWSVRAETSLVENSLDEDDVADGARFAQLVLMDPHFELSRMPSLADAPSVPDVACVKCSASARVAAGLCEVCFCEAFHRAPGDDRPLPRRCPLKKVRARSTRPTRPTRPWSRRSSASRRRRATSWRRCGRRRRSARWSSWRRSGRRRWRRTTESGNLYVHVIILSMVRCPRTGRREIGPTRPRTVR